MHTNCEPTVLVEEPDFYIAQCRHCARIGLSFNNILLGFSPREFIGYSHAVLQLDFYTCSTLFPDGQAHIILNTCHADIQCSFLYDDFEKLKQGLTEALLLLEVQEVLTKKE